MTPPPPRFPNPTRALTKPILFGLGVVAVFVLGTAALVFMPEEEAVDEAELAALIERQQQERAEPLSPYYYETRVVQRASIQIDSNPPGAFATLNSEVIGVTPLGLSDLDPGYYTFRVDHPDFLPLDTTLYLASGATYQLDAVLASRDLDVLPGDSAVPITPEASSAGRAVAQRERIQSDTRSAPGGVSAPTPATRFSRADPETIKRVWTTGSLSVTSEPSGARVTVDGQPRGATPLSVTGLTPGTHRVTLTMPGREALGYTVQIETGSVYLLKADF